MISGCLWVVNGTMIFYLLYLDGYIYLITYCFCGYWTSIGCFWKSWKIGKMIKKETMQRFCDDVLPSPFLSLKRALLIYFYLLFFSLSMKINIFRCVYWLFVLMDPFLYYSWRPGSTASSKNNLSVRKQGGPLICSWL